MRELTRDSRGKLHCTNMINNNVMYRPISIILNRLVHCYQNELKSIEHLRRYPNRAFIKCQVIM